MLNAALLWTGVSLKYKTIKKFGLESIRVVWNDKTELFVEDYLV
jgi:hypothetical protein